MDFNIRPSVFSLEFAGAFGCAAVFGEIVLRSDVGRSMLVAMVGFCVMSFV